MFGKQDRQDAHVLQHKAPITHTQPNEPVNKRQDDRFQHRRPAHIFQNERDVPTTKTTTKRPSKKSNVNQWLGLGNSDADLEQKLVIPYERERPKNQKNTNDWFRGFQENQRVRGPFQRPVTTTTKRPMKKKSAANEWLMGAVNDDSKSDRQNAPIVPYERPNPIAPHELPKQFVPYEKPNQNQEYGFFNPPPQVRNPVYFHQEKTTTTTTTTLKPEPAKKHRPNEWLLGQADFNTAQDGIF